MEREMRGELRIGAQGWNYADWVGPFYPRGTRSADFLDLYVRALDTVEVDSTFYAIPTASSVEGWCRRAPANFLYSPKLPQEITHVRRLVDAGEVLAAFCERAREFGDRLGVILIQMPPDFSPRVWGAVENFLPLLPPDLKFALEFRDRAWLEDERLDPLLDLLQRHGVSLALCDSKWLPLEKVLALAQRPTADFAYVRWLGPRELTDYSRLQIDHTPELERWAAAFRTLSAKTSLVLGYVNNHYEGHSPATCNRFKRMLDLPVVDPDELITQPSLF
jgi:uncharacterized protein YecE (DUF72 family)